MTKRLQGAATIGIVAALALVSGLPAMADVAVRSTTWTCEHEGTELTFARLEMTRSSDVDAGEQEVPLSEVNEPFTCSFPWGEIQVEVTDYASLRDNLSCGAAEVWGMKIIAEGRVLEDIPADSARACHLDDFNPFQGWVEVNTERVVVCRAQRDGSTHDCAAIETDQF